MDNDKLYVSAAEAAKMLGVSVPTLYAYVSRERIRSEAVEGSRSRKYWKGDVERLRDKAGATDDVRDMELPIGSESGLTLITDGGLYFRGHDAIELSKHASIESVAALLWDVDEAALFNVPTRDAAEIWEAMRMALHAGLGVIERALVCFPMLERLDPRAYDLSRAGCARTGADVLRWYAALLVKSKKLPTGPLHAFVAKAMKAPPGFDEVIRTLLVLAADHEFDPITYAVRAVANVGVTPYQAVTTGFMVTRGQRFQVDRFAAATRFLKEILASKKGHSAVVQRLRNRESLPGFSSANKLADPRTAALMGALRNALPDDPQLALLEEAEKSAFESVGAVLENIMPTIFIGHRLGFEGEELALAGLGRMVGWIAHSTEQFHQHELIRPRAKYVGPLPK